MNSTTHRQLPGITFEAVPPPIEEALPRMDIAAFVGFASSGPVDSPVPIEDMNRFREIFGPDLPLAWDPATGKIQYALLAPTVESFFKNKGKRCWVVRLDIDSELDTGTGIGARRAYDSGLFLDPDLEDIGTRALAEEINQKYYIRGIPLTGIHSLWPKDEITLISVPDALHPQWKYSEKKAVEPLEPPVLQLTIETLSTGSILLQWSPVIPGESQTGEAIYRLEESADPLFTAPVTRYLGTGTDYSMEFPPKCAQYYFYRVIARFKDQVSPWSNTVGALLPPSVFEICTPPLIVAPVLTLTPEQSPSTSFPTETLDSYLLEWNQIAGATGYIVEESLFPGFDISTVLYQGTDTQYELKYRTRGPYYYRVRPQDMVFAGWSNTCIIMNHVVIRWQFESVEEYESGTAGELVKIQQGLLRFCAARGDVITILGFPKHYRESQVEQHIQALAVGMALQENIDEPSFSAAYHPWVYTSLEFDEGAGAMRYIPPDGLVCGTIAARTLDRGAWIAPANQPFKNVIALEFPIDRAKWQLFFDIQVNALREDPRGFMVMSADTLSANELLQPINVRRLLILIRRLALREGMTYVFQPNNSDFRRRVKKRFEHILADLYSRGAFAGDEPSSAYQVVTDASVNTPTQVEKGRFIIELRVAPSRPLSFITVRLVQAHQDNIMIQEM